MVDDIFYVEEGKWGPMLIVHSPWNSRALALVRGHGIQEISLRAVPLPDNSMEFLRQMPHLRALHYSGGVEDLTPIESLQELRSLRLANHSKRRIDFSQLPNLEEFSGDWCGAVAGILDVKGLRVLGLASVPKSKIPQIAELSQLQELALFYSGIERLDSLACLKDMRKIRLTLLKKLSGNEFLAGYDRLEELWVQACSGFHSLEPLRNLIRLKKVCLEDCGPIESLKPIEGHVEIESFVLMGRRKTVLDGNYSYVEDLPNLQWYFR